MIDALFVRFVLDFVLSDLGHAAGFVALVAGACWFFRSLSPAYPGHRGGA